MQEKELRVKDIGEFLLVDRLVETLGTAARGSGQGVIRGIGDDAAVLQGAPGQRLLASCDMLVEGVHFNWDYISPEQLGWRALAANLSDMAAMGAKPRWALVSLGIPPNIPVKKVEGIYRGLSRLALEFGVVIVGGDTASSPRVTVINITILGELSRTRIAYRSGANEGDLILVTGSLGKSAAGLACLTNKLPVDATVKEATQAHLTPWPRVREAALLVNGGGVGALNDISDGLASEIHEIALASGLGAIILEERLPISAATLAVADRLKQDPLKWALAGGEDFELLLTLPGGKGAPLRVRKLVRALKRNMGTALTPVGRMLPPGEGIKIQRANNTIEELPAQGYSHFRCSLP